MKKNDFFLKTFTITIILSLLGCITGITYAWFSQANKVELDTIYKGTSAGAYFAYGDGSKDSPFGINEPRHLYNLAWLQYLGQFNNDTDDDNKIDSQYYFELDSDIDMNNLVLPPIGTEENPFIGNFNGKEYTISNLIISNSIDSDNITNYPYIVNSSEFNNDKPEVIGFFGVVGYLPDDETNYSLSSITETSGTDTTETPVNQVQNLYLNNITVKNTSSQLLAGFLAGYVNGSMTDCGVHYCNFDIASGTTNISNLSTSVSKYSYVGAINTNKYKIDGDTSGGGQEDDFGGSVDMLSINRRLDYMVSAIQNNLVTNGSNSYGDNAYWTNSDIYDISVSTNKQSSETYWNEGTISSLFCYYLWRGTYLPLNIDEVGSGLKDENGELLITESDVNGWHLTDFYKSGTRESITSTNTGYIVGGNPNVRTNVMPIAGYQRSSTSTPYAGIYKSMGLSSIDTSGKTFGQFETTTPIQLLTISDNNTLYRIVDEKNKSNSYPGLTSITNETYSSSNFSKYEQVIGNFRKSMTNAKTIHGFHFLQSIDMSSITTSKHAAKICGNDYANYEFINSSLNFTLRKDGYISTLMGGYYRQGYDCTCFDIYSVSRNDAGEIQNIKKITQIYKKSGKTIHKYLDSNGKTSYSDGSSSSSGMTLVADFDYLCSSSNLCIKEGAAYYFEFPAIEGDYVIGASKQNGYNAYLMYLDIGANASSETGEDEKNTLSIDFVWATSDSSEAISLIKITDTAYVKSEVVLEITVSSETSAKRSYFYYKRIAPVSSGTSSTFSYVYYYGDCGGLAISNVGTEGNAILKTSKDEVMNA